MLAILVRPSGDRVGHQHEECAARSVERDGFVSLEADAMRPRLGAPNLSDWKRSPKE